jgi:hypothetical protein
MQLGVGWAKALGDISAFVQLEKEFFLAMDKSFRYVPCKSRRRVRISFVASWDRKDALEPSSIAV